MSEPSLGIAHFLSQTDSVGLGVLTVLATMSLLSWYLILFKLWQHSVIRARSKTFRDLFRRVRHVDEVWPLQGSQADNPFARLLDEGLLSCRLLQEARTERTRKVDARGFEIAAPDDFVSAALHRAIAHENRKLEGGMTVLGSIASSAPFVGLFGTVWGIYHALIAIGISGQATLGMVAGPVGEALIMTACGLAVAIPAVLGYNAFTRLNRNLVGELESYAHEVFSLLGLGRTAAANVLEFAPRVGGGT
jgi:biopolymer transport protein ExbB